ncbi:hypothetical protein [Fortiea sp. LEGE XX443]|nr:hypothetical protein [Fortiea sp. LEGE XX443]
MNLNLAGYRPSYSQAYAQLDLLEVIVRSARAENFPILHWIVAEF